MNATPLDAIMRVADAADVLLWSGTGDEADRFNTCWLAYVGGGVGDWRAVVHPDDRARCEVERLAAVRESGGDEIQLRLLADDGSYHVHHVRFVVGAGRWFGVARDLEKARADYAARVKDRFLAAVSHELRAPIAAVLLWERLLRDSELGPEDRMHALDAIRQSAVVQARLVDDLLDVARATAGKLTVRLSAIELAPLLVQALEVVRPLARAKDHELTSQIAPDLGVVDGDASRLVQVVENILINAIKFTPAGGHIELAANREAEAVVIEIADDGRGIAPEFVPYVFELFRQFDDQGSDGGLGLGLAIARELVTLHGGTIEVFSEGRGRGARFRISLPTTAKVARPEVRQSTRRTLANIRILVVDDDPHVLAALERLLVRAGGIVECARSVAEAWEAIEVSVPDIVVSDIAMPGADGYELIRRIRSDHARVQFVPAIALTAHAAHDEAERAISAGFDGHLAKPIELDVLIASIVRLVRTSAAPHTG